MITKLGLGFVVTLLSAQAFARPHIEIYYARPLSIDGPMIYRDGKDVDLFSAIRRDGALGMAAVAFTRRSKAHKNAYNTIAIAADFYAQQFGRNSFDGQGGTIKATVGIGKIDFMLPLMGGLKQNAAWVQGQNRFIFGDGGTMLDGFEKQVDVVAHEYTHAVVQFTSNLGPNGQTGALNEHFADLFGEMAEQSAGRSTQKWLLGENVLTAEAKAAVYKKEGRHIQALRDMMNPENGLDKQPSHMKDIPVALGPSCKVTEQNDRCGVHLLNGIPNKMAALIVDKLGWAKTKHMFYVVMTEKMDKRLLGKDPQFEDYARELLNQCAAELTPADCDVVFEAQRTVGLR